MPYISPWMTWELSFRKKLYKYLGMNADMQAYASAVKNTTANEGETVGAATFTSLLFNFEFIHTFVVKVQVQEWSTERV